MLIPNQYGITARWGNRVEDVDNLSRRTLNLIKRLQFLAPHFAVWYQRDLYDDRSEMVSGDLAQISAFIPRNYLTNDSGAVAPGMGYWTHFYNVPPTYAGPNFWSLNFHAGTRFGQQHLQLASMGEDHSPLPQCVTPDVLEGALFAITDCFEPDICAVWSMELNDLMDNPRPRGSQIRHYWMVTLSPRFAQLVVPPPSVIQGRRPNGSLYMAATAEPFSIDSPDQLAKTQLIYGALSHLDFSGVFYGRTAV